MFTYKPVKEIELVNGFEQIRYLHVYDEFLVRNQQRQAIVVYNVRVKVEIRHHLNCE
jgi:hypothetical protein